MFEKQFHKESLVLLCLVAFIVRVISGFSYIHGSFYPIEVWGDEGEYLYGAWEVARGRILYKDVYEAKLPGIFYIIGFICLISGNSVIAARLFVAFLCAVTTSIIYLIGKELFDERVGIVGALFYSIEGLSTWYGRYVVTEPVMNFFTCIAILIFLRAFPKGSIGKLFLSGILMGIAFLVRQTAALNLMAIFLFVCWIKVYRNMLNKESFNMFEKCKFFPSLLAILLGFLVPIGLAYLYFHLNGAFSSLQDALYVTVTYHSLYPHSYLSLFGKDFPTIRAVVIKNPIMWGLGLSSIPLLFKRTLPGSFLILWFVTSLCVTFLPTTIYDHFFVQAIPPLTITTAVIVSEKYSAIATIRRNRFMRISIMVAIAGISLFWPYHWITKSNLKFLTLNDQMYVAEYVKQHTNPDEKIFVYDNPAYCFLCERELSHKYAWYFSETDLTKIFTKDQINEIVASLEDQNVRYVILSNKGAPSKGQLILDYIFSKYVEILNVKQRIFVYVKKT